MVQSKDIAYFAMSWLDMWYKHSQTQVSVQNSGPMVLHIAYPHTRSKRYKVIYF